MRPVRQTAPDPRRTIPMALLASGGLGPSRAQRKWCSVSLRLPRRRGRPRPERATGRPPCPISSRPLYGGPLCSSSSVLVRLAMGVSAGWSPSRAPPSTVPQRTWSADVWVDALRRPGPCARGRRRMGSVGGWPLAIPITVASGGNRDGGSLTGEPPEPVPHPRGVRVVPSRWLTPRRWCTRPFSSGELGVGSQMPVRERSAGSSGQRLPGRSSK